jgi:hypothetical protein
VEEREMRRERNEKREESWLLAYSSAVAQEPRKRRLHIA